jgi:hypothetical protein
MSNVSSVEKEAINKDSARTADEEADQTAATGTAEGPLLTHLVAPADPAALPRIPAGNTRDPHPPQANQETTTVIIVINNSYYYNY